MNTLGYWLARFWPRRVAGQLIALLLVTLMLAQLLGVWIFLDEGRSAIRSAERRHVVERTVGMVRLIEHTPDPLHRQMLEAVNNPYMRFWLRPQPRLPQGGDEHSHEELLSRLGESLDDGPRRGLRVWVEDDDDHEHDDQERHLWPRRFWPELAVAVQLRDRQWLHVGLSVRRPPRDWWAPPLTSLVLTAVGLSLIVVLAVRRITRPLARLAAAAERAGRGEALESLPEEGPEDMRQTTRAFNRMHDRLQRFVADRTRMLAAISHDLRTPITSLRLQAEFIAEDDTRTRILAITEEMQRMTEATLSFAREEASREDTRSVDLSALVDSLCEDLAELGMAVQFQESPRAPHACRPVALRRALRNLIENAVRYGKLAQVGVRPGTGTWEILIEDRGPGIAEADRERVFAPFVRLETSRNQETGGIGLGMAIARSIVRSHGGDIHLEDRPAGGLRVVVRLPRAGGATG